MILVTGSTGFIGRSVGRVLVQSGHDWRAYTSRMNSPQDLRQQLVGVDTVIHLAGSEARGRGRLLRHVDVEGTQRLIEEARRAGVSRLIVASRINADPHDIHPLLRAKGEVERNIRRSRIPYTIVRSATLFGRDDRFTELVLGLAQWSWPLVWLPGGGQIAMQPLWVEDYARCLVAAVDRPDMVSQIVTVAGSERFSYLDIVNAILEIAGLSRIRLRLPATLLRPTAAAFFSWWRWPPVSRFMVDRFFVPEVAELDSVWRQFGFRPARFGDSITYLTRGGMRSRLMRH